MKILTHWRRRLVAGLLHSPSADRSTSSQMLIRCGTRPQSGTKQCHSEGAMYSHCRSETLAMCSKSWSEASTVASFMMA